MNILLNEEFCQRLSLTLLHSLWEGAIVAIASLVAMRILRSRSAQLRYTVLTASQVMLFALLPITYYMLSTGISLRVANEAAVESVPQIRARADDDASTSPSFGFSSPSFEGPSSGSAPGYTRETAVIYLTGVGVMLVRILLGLYGGKRLLSSSSTITDPRILLAIARAVERMGFRYHPAFAYCASVVVPSIVGICKPTLLLPFSVASGLSTAQLEALLMHELAHIRRFDHLTNLVQRVAEAFLFFNPCIWLLSSRLQRERELCCDDLVVSRGVNANDYADALLRVAELSIADPATTFALVQLAATGNRSELKYRVIRILGDKSPGGIKLTDAAATFGGLAILSLFLVPVSLGMYAGPKYIQDDGHLSQLRAELVSDPGTANVESRPGWTRLQIAAAYGTLEEVNMLLNHGADPNRAQAMGWTPLHYAAALSRHQIAEALLRRGANSNAQNTNGTSPLHVALGVSPPVPRSLATPDIQMVSLLLTFGAKTDIVDKNGATPLHSAAWGSQIESARLLIRANAPVNAQDVGGKTPLHAACAVANKQLVAEILAAGADPQLRDSRGWSPLDTLGLHTRASNPVQEADIAQCAELLLSAGVTPELSTAVALGMLRQAEARLNQDRRAVNELPAKTLPGYRLLHWAAAVSSAEMCEVLIRFGADLHPKTREGYTPLHLAVARGTRNVEVVQKLLDAGADPNRQDNRGNTALHAAVMRVDAEMVKTLLAAKANVRISNSEGYTPLHLLGSTTVQHEPGESVRIASQLLTAGADLGARNSLGQPPLFAAIQGRRTALVRAYLDAGADPSITDHAGRTALVFCLALKDPDDDIAQLLISVGAHVAGMPATQVTDSF